MSLCPLCAAESDRWLDYRPPVPLRLHTIGEGTHGVRHGARVLDTIRAQRALIAEACRRDHQGVPG